MFLVVILQMGHETNTITFHTFMVRLCKQGKLQDTKKILYHIIKEGENPNVITFNTMVDALCKEGKLDNGMKLFSEMSNKIV